MRKANAARISNRFLYGKSGKYRHDHLHGYAHKGTGNPCQAGDEEVLLPRRVGAPQHSQTHTRTGAQPRHKAGKAQRTLHTVSYTHSPSPRDRQKSRMPSSA